MPYKDPQRQKEAQHKHYVDNKQEYRSRASRRRKELVEWLNNLKTSMSCEHCDENDPICLDFHHPDPAVKDKSISELVTTSMSKTRILAEIQKCLVLCSNCHRKEHRRLRLNQ